MSRSAASRLNRAGKRIALIVVIVLSLAGPVASGLAAQDAATPTAGTPTPAAVVREVLSNGDPAAAPDENLALVRYTIPAGIRLPAHTHPGMQAATIVSGTLLYTVVDGSVPVTRVGTGEVDKITPERGEVAIEPGDAFIEAEGVVHFGRNAGPDPVVILVASLFTIGAPPAHVVDATPAATPAS